MPEGENKEHSVISYQICGISIRFPTAVNMQASARTGMIAM